VSGWFKSVEEELRRALPVAAALGALLYLAAFVWSLSDVDLINPATHFPVAGLAEMINLPGETVVAPLLQFEIDIRLFYLLGPIVIILLHVYLITGSPCSTIQKIPLGRYVADLLPAALLVLILWRFVPYTEARSEGEVPASAQFLSFYHASALIADAFLIALSQAHRHDLPRHVRFWSGRVADYSCSLTI
jgi:hypothetical protein